MKRLILVVAVIAVLTSLAAVAPASAQSAVPTCGQWHRVQWGETLFRIALRYNTSVANLMGLNGLSNANLIYAGQSLCVSGGFIPNPGKTYTVQQGDTLFRIARTFGVNLYVLARVNNIVNVNLIYAGQRLSIPDVTIQ
ncbi:MAG: LysM peptidoglycan-binding domain-containing protein [Anaerolineae bacterium]|nr:LysM peptidoglycan-binding domain-containing protein [Anaerolineae bacterium]